MIWVAWRQQRLQILLTAALVAAVTGVMVFFRIDAVGYMRDHGITGCLAVNEDSCTSSAMNAFSSEYKPYVSIIPLVLLALPLLLGMFAGAPLYAREFEQGTQIFALAQSIGRNRWWATKAIMAGLPVATAMMALGLIGTWALRPLSYVIHGRIMTPGFEVQGIVLGAYAVLAFAIGATAGLLWRNTVAAMAVTIGLYLVVIVAVGGGARPGYLQPEEKRATVEETAAVATRYGGSWPPDDAWRVGSTYFNAAGDEVDFDPSSCKSSDNNVENCLRRQGIAGLSARCHPDSQFWTMQAIESGIVLTMAVVLLGLGVLRLRRRVL